MKRPPQSLRTALRPGADRRLGAGHRQQADPARPRPQGRRRAHLPGHADRPVEGGQRRRHRTLDRDHPRADRQARRLRARGRRASAPTEISVSLPDVTNAERAIDQVGTTAQLYFYDWEPNLIGREKAIGGHPGREPPAKAALEEANKEWKAAGRSTTKAGKPAADLRRRLSRRAYGAVKLASEQKPVAGLHNLLDDQTALLPVRRQRRTHKLIAGPEFTEEDLFITATGRKARRTERGRSSIKVPQRARSSSPNSPPTRAARSIEGIENAGWYALKDEPGALGHRHHQPEAGNRRTRPAERHLRLHRHGPRGLPGRHPPDRPARPGAGDRPGLRRRGRSALRPLRRRPRQRSQDAADHQLRREPGRDRRPHRRPDLGRLQQHPGSAGPGDLPADRRPADQPEADQPDPGLGDARQPGARTTGSRPASSASPWSSSSCCSSTACSG